MRPCVQGPWFPFIVKKPQRNETFVDPVKINALKYFYINLKSKKNVIETLKHSVVEMISFV